jgi:hypothetical protein
MDFDVPAPVLAARLMRVFAAHPAMLTGAAGWLKRFAMRAGALSLVRARPRALTFVMHSFMDASDVKPAWEALRRGQLSEEPRIRAAQERLQACSYAMSHPESDELVPACVQHSVLDPRENLKLQELLPLVPA